MKIYFGALILAFLLASCNNSQNKDEPVPYSSVKNLHKQELMDFNKKLVEVDYDLINKFIERRKWDMQVSETGLYWQIYSKTDGEQASSGKIAEFSYKTSLLNGNLIYSSQESGNRFMRLDRNQEESGLNEGIKKMKVGEKARFILPPHLAFGVTGDGYRIPYYSILVYEIELVSLRQPEEETNII